MSFHFCDDIGLGDGIPVYAFEDQGFLDDIFIVQCLFSLLGYLLILELSCLNIEKSTSDHFEFLKFDVVPI